MKKEEIIAIIGLLKLVNKDGIMRKNASYYRLEDWKRICLEAVYSIMEYPPAITKKYLSRFLGISPKKIQVWMQNRRKVSRIYLSPVYKPIIDSAIVKLKNKMFKGIAEDEKEECILIEVFIEIYVIVSEIEDIIF